MARDFRAKQVRTSIIIGSGSVESTKPHLGLVFYSASKASDFNGTRRTGGSGSPAPISNEHKTDTNGSFLNLTDARIGEDVWCLFDGHPGAQGSLVAGSGLGAPTDRAYGSTVLFLGNVAVSGSLFAERQMIEVDNTVAGDFRSPDTTTHYLAGGFHGDGASGTAKGATITNTGDGKFDGFVQTNEVKNFNSQHLTVTSETAGNIKFRSKAGGENSGNSLDIFDFDVHEPSLTIYDDADIDGDRDYFRVSVGAAGSTTIRTNDDGGLSANLRLHVDGGLTLDPGTGRITAQIDGNVYYQQQLTGNDVQWKGYTGATAGNVFTLKNWLANSATAPSVRIETDHKLEFRDANVYMHSHEADGIKMEATGNMLIGSTLADTKTLTLGNTNSTHMLLSPHGTPGSEKILIKNASGDTEAAAADAAIKIEATAGGITLDAGKDIQLSPAGGNVIMDDGTNPIFDFDTANPSLTIYDDADTDGDRDYFRVSVGASGKTEISTNDDDSTTAELWISPDSSLSLNPANGFIRFFLDENAQNSGQTTRYGDFRMTGTDMQVRDGSGSVLYTLKNVQRDNSDPKSFRMDTTKKIEFHDDSQYIHAPSDNNLTIKAPSAITLETDQYGAVCTRPEGIHFGNQARNGVATVNGENSEYRIFVATGSMGRASAQNAADPFDQGGTGNHPLIQNGSLVISNRSALTADGDGNGPIVMDGALSIGNFEVANLTVTNNMIVHGSTSTLLTETITSTDPVLDIGGTTDPGGAGVQDDTYSPTVTSAEANKDRGLVMRYWNGSASATAFMGIDPSEGFKLFSAASESSGAYSGTYADLHFKTRSFRDQTGAQIGYQTAPTGPQSGAIRTDVKNGGWIVKKPGTSMGGAADSENAGPFYQLQRLQDGNELTAGQNLGEIRFAEGDEASLNISAQINATATGTWSGNGTCPAELGFFTRSTDAASLTKKMVVRPDGNVGIGVADPDYRLEVMNEDSFQQKWSRDSDSFATMRVVQFSHTTLATGESGDFTLDAGGDIELNADGDHVSIKFGGAAGQIDFTQANSGDGIIQQKVDAKDLVFQQFDGNEVIRVGDDRKLYFFDKGGEYISGDGTDLTIDAGGDITIGTATTKIEWGSDSGEHIVGDGSNGLTMASGAAINLTAATDVNIPAQVGLTFGAATEKIEADSSNNLSIIAAGDIELNADGGDITLKDGSNTAFSINAATANTGIVNDQAGNEVFRITNNLVRMASGKKIEFADAGESIHSDGDDLIISSGRHVNLAGSSAQLNFQDSGNHIKIDTGGSDDVMKFSDGQNSNVTLNTLATVEYDATAAGLGFQFAGSLSNDPKDARIRSSFTTTFHYASNTETYLNNGNGSQGIESPGKDLHFFVTSSHDPSSAEGTAGTPTTDSLSLGYRKGRSVAGFGGTVMVSGSFFVADDTVTTEESSGRITRHALTTGRMHQNAGNTIFSTNIRTGHAGSTSNEEHFWLKAGTAGVGGLFLHSNRMLAFSDNVASSDASLAIQRVLHTVEGNTSQKCMQHKGHIIPQADNTFNLGTADRRFANLYTGDLHLNNMGSSNDVDGTSGNWTIQEGEDNLYVINNLTGKRFKMMLQPVEDGE